MANMKTLQTFDTEYSADSTEWCPIQGHTDILLCGTYQLDQSEDKAKEDASGTKQTRIGRLYVFKYSPQIDVDPLQLQSTMDMPGILDIKWCSTTLEESPTFGLVNSVGQLRIYKLINDRADLLSEVAIGQDVLGLSLDWSNRIDSSSVPFISCSSSDGCVSIYHLTPSGLKQESKWKAHDFEAWITAFNYWNTDVLYSGGDDCKLKVWDKRLDSSHPVLTSKRHTMGVCSIQSCPVKEHLLCTGSYDENVFIWDSRNMKRVLAETSLGGGIWRVKWEPHYADMILTATMYNGFHVVDVTKLNDELPVLHHYQEHSSLAYGADWYHGNIQLDSRENKQHETNTVPSSSSDSFTCGENTIASCSFYDHCLKLWTCSATNKTNT